MCSGQADVSRKRVIALLANNDYCCCKEIIWGDDRGHPRLFAWILVQASSLRLEKKQNSEFLQLRQLQMIDVCNCCLVIAPNDSCATKAFWYKPHPPLWPPLLPPFFWNLGEILLYEVSLTITFLQHPHPAGPAPSPLWDILVSMLLMHSADPGGLVYVP